MIKNNNYKEYLLRKIKTKKLKIGIIGLGYVGLPLAYAFSKKNISVLGFDIDKEKIQLLNKGKSYINYFSSKNIKEMQKSNFVATNSFSKISNVDVIILCLPTPLKKNKSPEMRYIKNTLQKIFKFLKKGQVLSLESTTYPGTSRQFILPKLPKQLKIGNDFFLIYSPEREDPGNKKFSLTKVPKVVGGFSHNCLEIGSKIYKLLRVNVVKTSSLEVAEFTKLLENIYRSINIGMINELKLLCIKMKIDIFEVIKAARTKPFGFQAFYPGPGYGGHCIPIDPFLLTWRAKQFKFDTKFIKLSGEINESLPRLIVNKILKLNKKKKLKKILLVGVAYKKNVDDIRESPALKIIQLLRKNKIEFDFMDPFIKKIKSSKILEVKKSVKIDYSNIKSYDLTLLITDHDKLDYGKIKKFSRLIIDTRGRYQFDPKNSKLIHL